MITSGQTLGTIPTAEVAHEEPTLRKASTLTALCPPCPQLLGPCIQTAWRQQQGQGSAPAFHPMAPSERFLCPTSTRPFGWSAGLTMIASMLLQASPDAIALAAVASTLLSPPLPLLLVLALVPLLLLMLLLLWLRLPTAATSAASCCWCYYCLC